MAMLIPILLVQILVVSLMGAVFLRLGCWAFNKMSGRQAAMQNKYATQSQKPMPNIQNVAATKDDKNPFAAPTSYAMDGAVVVDESLGVPTPSFLKALAIMCTYAFTGIAIVFCMTFMLSSIEPSGVQTSRTTGATVAAFNFASVFINFCLLGVIIRYALPTTAGKAAIVTVLTATFAIITGLIIFVPLALFMLSARAA